MFKDKHIHKYLQDQKWSPISLHNIHEVINLHVPQSSIIFHENKIDNIIINLKKKSQKFPLKKLIISDL